MRSFLTRKIVISAAIGGAFELFDFVIYLFLAPILAAVFFPHHNESLSFLATLGGFTAGYFARPLGGMIYGHFGDRIGRVRTLVVSLFLMAIPTFLISCLPTYSVIGIFAPILLILFRFAQGLAMGGDVPGAICFIGEHAGQQRRGFMTCCLLCGMNIGAVIASILVAMLIASLTPSSMASWGFRIPFLIGAILAIVGFYIRQHTTETLAFQQYMSMGKLERWPLKTLVRTHFNAISLGFVFAGLAAAITAIMSLFMATYMTHYMGIQPDAALWMNSISIGIYSISCLAAGFMIDRLGALFVLQMGTMGILILAYPIFMLISSHHLMLVMLGLLISAPLMGCVMGPIPSLLIELFPISIRYSGIGVAYNFGFSLFAGISPLIVTYFISTTGIVIIPAFYIICLIAIAIPAIFVLSKKIVTIQSVPQSQS